MHFLKNTWSKLKNFLERWPLELRVASFISFFISLILWLGGSPVGLSRVIRIFLFSVLLSYFIRVPRGNKDCQRIAAFFTHYWAKLKGFFRSSQDYNPEREAFIARNAFEEFNMVSPSLRSFAFLSRKSYFANGYHAIVCGSYSMSLCYLQSLYLAGSISGAAFQQIYTLGFITLGLFNVVWFSSLLALLGLYLYLLVKVSQKCSYLHAPHLYAPPFPDSPPPGTWEKLKSILPSSEQTVERLKNAKMPLRDPKTWGIISIITGAFAAASSLRSNYIVSKTKEQGERHHREDMELQRENMKFQQMLKAEADLDKTNAELRELAKEKSELVADKNKQWFSTDTSPHDNQIKSWEARELELNQLKTIQIQKVESFQTSKPSSLLDDFPDEI